MKSQKFQGEGVIKRQKSKGGPINHFNSWEIPRGASKLDNSMGGW